tara:strand:+ start:2731 stop:3438 length:708 start_codon:yes stop_codon:yes gene_type:complete
MHKRIKAITFDLDDTFWDVKPVLINAEMKTRKFIEDSIGPLEWGSWEDFKLIRERLIVEDASYEFDVGKLRKKLLLMKIQEQISDPETANELSEKAFQLFFKERNKVEFFPYVLDEIEKLAQIYELGCLTNGNADIEMIGIGKFFKFNISSKDVNANKPNKNHFQKAVELLGISKEEILHIGDHKINDMLGAISYGVKALWFNPDKEDWDLDDIKKPSEFNSWQGVTEKINNFYS